MTELETVAALRHHLVERQLPLNDRLKAAGLQSAQFAPLRSLLTRGCFQDRHIGASMAEIKVESGRLEFYLRMDSSSRIELGCRCVNVVEWAKPCNPQIAAPSIDNAIAIQSSQFCLAVSLHNQKFI